MHSAQQRPIIVAFLIISTISVIIVLYLANDVENNGICMRYLCNYFKKECTSQEYREIVSMIFIFLRVAIFLISVTVFHLQMSAMKKRKNNAISDKSSASDKIFITLITIVAQFGGSDLFSLKNNQDMKLISGGKILMAEIVVSIVFALLIAFWGNGRVSAADEFTENK